MTADLNDTGVRRVLIADDRVRTRRALSAVLATRAGLKLIGEAADGDEALVAIERLQPDIVILEVRMPRLDGITATMQIKTRWPCCTALRCTRKLAVARWQTATPARWRPTCERSE